MKMRLAATEETSLLSQVNVNVKGMDFRLNLTFGFRPISFTFSAKTETLNDLAIF